MSAFTQGTPEWLLRLETAQMQLKPDNLINWLVSKASSHGVPQEVIEAQLQRLGVTPVPQKDEEVAKTETTVDTAQRTVLQGKQKRKPKGDTK